MALIHKLTDGTNTVDLRAPSTELKWLQGFIPKVASPTGDGSIPPYLLEVIPTLVKNTTADNMAGDLQKLAALALTAAEYWVDPTQETPVWYHQQMTAESGERRALVKSIHLEFTDPVGDYLSAVPPIASGRSANLMIERHPYWERPTEVVSNADTPSAAASVVYDYTTTNVVGDVSARLKRLDIISPVGGDPIDRMWIGVRGATKRAVTPADFVNIWECEDGTNNASESGVTDDPGTDVNGSSPGGGSGVFVKVIPTDLDWDDTFRLAMSITVGDIRGGETALDQTGKHLWLLRAKVTSGTWEFVLAFGYESMDTANMVEGEYILISNTSWDYYEMGVAPIPLRDLQAFPSGGFNFVGEETWGIQVWARRTSGSGHLYLDCLCPIPVDEGFMVVEGMALVGGGTLSGTVIASSPKDVFAAYSTIAGGNVIALPQPRLDNMRLPLGDGRMIIVYARAASSDLTDFIQINNNNTGRYIPRWLSLRGGE